MLRKVAIGALGLSCCFLFCDLWGLKATLAVLILVLGLRVDRYSHLLLLGFFPISLVWGLFARPPVSLIEQTFATAMLIAYVGWACSLNPSAPTKPHPPAFPKGSFIFRVLAIYVLLLGAVLALAPLFVVPKATFAAAFLDRGRLAQTVTIALGVAITCVVMRIYVYPTASAVLVSQRTSPMGLKKFSAAMSVVLLLASLFVFYELVWTLGRRDYVTGLLLLLGGIALTRYGVRAGGDSRGTLVY